MYLRQVTEFFYDQETQTESLIITEPKEYTNGPINNGDHNPRQRSISPSKESNPKLRKSASFSSSSGNSYRSSSLGSATSTNSLRSSPLRGSTRTLKSDQINTFQKWETTVESISYVKKKTVAVSPSNTTSDTEYTVTTRSRSSTPNSMSTTTTTHINSNIPSHMSTRVTAI